MSDVRSRAVLAMADVVAEQGYARTTVDDVLRRAGMSRRTFYKVFENREDCFLAAYDAVRQDTMTRLTTGYSTAIGRWPGHVQAALTAVLEYYAARPELARLFVVEAVAAGASGLDRHERTMQQFALHLARSNPVVGHCHAVALEATVGAVHRVVHARIVAGRAGELPTLVPQLTAVVRRLAPPGGDD
jgi:AcrR family transcriptional regulator